jgi:hypothetical protein
MSRGDRACRDWDHDRFNGKGVLYGEDGLVIRSLHGMESAEEDVHISKGRSTVMQSTEAFTESTLEKTDRGVREDPGEHVVGGTAMLDETAGFVPRTVGAGGPLPHRLVWTRPSRVRRGRHREQPARMHSCSKEHRDRGS